MIYKPFPPMVTSWVWFCLLFTVYGLYWAADGAVQDLTGHITRLEQKVGALKPLVWELQSDIQALEYYNIKPEYLRLLQTYSGVYDLDLEFMVRLMLVESGGNQYAVSNKYAYGLMQVQLPTARDLDPTINSHWQLFHPDVNIRLGCQYFRWLLDQYNDDYRLAAIAYNWGIGNVNDRLHQGRPLNDAYYQQIQGLGSF